MLLPSVMMPFPSNVARLVRRSMISVSEFFYVGLLD